MKTDKLLSKLLETSKEILFDDSSKIILMSDCHRGDGTWSDDFANNQNIFFRALSYYYDNNYTYIELGDGEELWENKRLLDIIREHSHIYWLLSKFYLKNKLYLLYGNHDKEKKNHRNIRKYYFEHFTEDEKEALCLFKDIYFYEALILKHRVTGNKILLTHGHQGDLVNDTLGGITKYIVRYFWRPLELLAIHDPTSVAKNYLVKEKIEKKLSEWSEKNNQMLIVGHTHRPRLPNYEEPLYFNDGSCVHPRCITGIEIKEGKISLIKWSVKSKSDGTLYIGKDILSGPKSLNKYFKSYN